MPSRIIREGILTSERINALSEPAELFYRRLMSVVDDYGRFFAKPSLLRANCYPLKLDSVKEDQILAHLAECLDARLIIVYEVDSKSYLQLLDFKQQVRAKESKYPAPNSQTLKGSLATATHPCTGVHLDGGGDVVEDGIGGGDEGEYGKKPNPRKTRLPENFGISPAVRSWAAQKGFTQLEARLEDFIGKAKASGYTYVDWDQAFMNAIRNDWAKLAQTNARMTKDAARKATIDGLTGKNRSAGSEFSASSSNARGVTINGTAEQVG